MRCGRLLVVLMVMGGLIAACSAGVADIATDESTADGSADNRSSDDGAAVTDPGQSASEPAGTEAVDEDAGGADEEASAVDSAAAGFSVLESLGQIPLSAADEAGGNLQVSMADVDAAADQARLRRPLDPLDTQDLADFFGPLTGGPVDVLPNRVFVPLPALFVGGRVIAEIDEFVDEVGFSPGEITTFVALDVSQVSFTVLGGVSIASGLPEVAPGVATLGDGEDFVPDFEDISAARPLGLPLRVAERNGSIALSTSTSPLVSWAGDGSYATLQDQPVLARLATRLDEEDVVSAFLVTDDDAIFEGIGLGWEAAEQSSGVIVLAYTTEAIAAEQAPLIEAAFNGESLVSGRPMSELVTVDAVEARGAEIVVNVGFPDGRQPIILLNLLVQSDIPFSLPG